MAAAELSAGQRPIIRKFDGAVSGGWCHNRWMGERWAARAAQATQATRATQATGATRATQATRATRAARSCFDTPALWRPLG
jgi:hypothetical protein